LHYATAPQVGCRYMLTNDRDFKAGSTLKVIPISSLFDH
jgi:predicted nucleic acid-binding protein